jgi:putative NADPH-quinone reductase
VRGLGRVLVIADDRDAHMATLAEDVCRVLTRRAVSVESIGLNGFEPAMSERERRAYESDTPICDDAVATSADAVRRADSLVFVCPTLSNGLSAPVKGWLDRVLVPGVAFLLDERTGRVRPALGHISTLGLIAVDDRSALRRWLEHDNARRVIFRALRLVCGLKTRTRSLRVTTAVLDREADLAVALQRMTRW